MGSFVCDACGMSYEWNDTSRPPGICGECYLRNAVGVPVRGPQSSVSSRNSESFRLFWPAIGAIAGAWIGYLLRPSAFLIGQLPFEMVITGGAQLNGIDSILAPLARQSLSLMVAGAIVGALIGLGYQSFRPRQSDRDESGDSTQSEPQPRTRPRRNHSRTPTTGGDDASLRPPSEILTNRGVLDLLRAGLSDALIVEKIRSSDCDFDLETSDLVELKSLGLNEGVSVMPMSA